MARHGEGERTRREGNGRGGRGTHDDAHGRARGSPDRERSEVEAATGFGVKEVNSRTKLQQMLLKLLWR